MVAANTFGILGALLFRLEGGEEGLEWKDGSGLNFGVGFFQPMERGEQKSCLDWWPIGMEKYNGLGGHVANRDMSSGMDYGLFHRVKARGPTRVPEDHRSWPKVLPAYELEAHTQYALPESGGL